MARWEQLQNEPDEAYKRFLYYLHSRPRSLERAYAMYQADDPEAIKSKKKQYPPGSWTKDSTEYDWKARATAYDIHHLTTTGATATVQFIAALEAYSSLALEALLSGKIRPTSWEQVSNALGTLGQYINADAIQALRDRGNDSEGDV